MNATLNESNRGRGPAGLAVLFSVAGMSLLLGACMSASQHREGVRDDKGDRLTVGTVQKEIHVGMSGAQVSEILGAPNIVTTDENRREVWIYDKISTEVAYSKSEGGISALVFGGSGGALGSVGAGSGASASSQRTLTVVVKFDENKLVRDFSYHQSSF